MISSLSPLLDDGIYVILTNCQAIIRHLDEKSLKAYIAAMSDVGKVIRIMRHSLGLTLREVAEPLGMKAQYLSDIEAGRRTLADRHFAKLLPGIREPATRAALQELKQRAKVIMCGA